MTQHQSHNEWIEKFDKEFVVKSNAGTDLLRYTDANLIKSFISKTREEAYNDGMRFGRQDEAENCIKHSQEAVNEKLATIRERVEKKKQVHDKEDDVSKYHFMKVGRNEICHELLAELDNLERR
jgi:hypothetical protein